MVRCLMLMCVFLVACTTHTPQKRMAKKKRSNIRCFEKLDTADVNKRFLEYRKKEDQEFPEEQFMQIHGLCGKRHNCDKNRSWIC